MEFALVAALSAKGQELPWLMHARRVHTRFYYLARYLLPTTAYFSLIQLKVICGPILVLVAIFVLVIVTDDVPALVVVYVHSISVDSGSRLL